MTTADRVRLDRWLNAARIFPSRDDAARACDGGKVDVGGAAAKPSKTIAPGDEIRVTTPRGVRILVVVGLAEKRQSPPLAKTLYDDRTPPPPPLPPGMELIGKLPRRERGAGRPTKRERRELEKWRGD